MSARSVRELERIRQISEVNSGEEDSISEDDQSESQSDFPDSGETQDDNVVADENEYFLNLRRVQRHQRFLSDPESDSEQNFEDTVTAVDGTVWQRIREGPAIGRPSLTFREVSGPTAHAKRNIMSGKASSAFFVIIDHTIIENIKKYTEAKALRVLGTAWELPIKKLYAFIGVLYARGAYQAKNLSISHLWNSKWGPPFFSNAMSRNAFSEILRFLRFDDRSQRIQRLGVDKFALISDVWKQFIENCQSCYKPGADLSIDEQLFPTKTRCKFTQYMPNKPDKFGMKFWLASDVKTKYLVNGSPYLGRDETRPTSIPLSEFVVMKLVEPFTNCRRNITTDNFFTTASLAAKLLAKRTTLVGTMRANRRELPALAKTTKDNLKLLSTMTYKSNDCTLTIYKSKPRKKVVILSTKHKTVKIKNNRKKTPETISYYNKTKFGVDIVDQMARKYSVKSKCNRWPVQVFFNILDLAGINSWILYQETTGLKLSRQSFLLQLADELVTEYLEFCEEEKENQREGASSSSNNNSQSRKKCQIRLCAGNKTTQTCIICKKFVCGKCTKEKPILCKKCN